MSLISSLGLAAADRGAERRVTQPLSEDTDRGRRQLQRVEKDLTWGRKKKKL